MLHYVVKKEETPKREREREREYSQINPNRLQRTAARRHSADHSERHNLMAVGCDLMHLLSLSITSFVLLGFL